MTSQYLHFPGLTKNIKEGPKCKLFKIIWVRSLGIYLYYKWGIS